MQENPDCLVKEFKLMVFMVNKNKHNTNRDNLFTIFDNNLAYEFL